MSKKVIVAMSGGVDSSTAAYLLQKKGFAVCGINLLMSDSNKHISGARSAKQAADKLKIPFSVIDCKKEFKEKVVKYFYDEYKSGRTPNPCVFCNEEIKFFILNKTLATLNADYIVTGHYAKINYNIIKKKYFIKKSADKKRDQSYFLYRLSQASLKKIIFPLGSLTKETVIALAKSQGLSCFNRPPSQEICFIPGNDYKKFLLKNFPDIIKPGKITDTDGKILGGHNGVAFYTIGQRKGLGIASKHPLYVIRLDVNSNSVVVGKKDQTYSKALIADKACRNSFENLKQGIKYKARIRYNEDECEAFIVSISDKTIKVEFKEPQSSITPGQSIVFYKKDILMAGAIIKKVIK